MTKIAVLVSGGGTNLQALIDAEKRGELGEGKISLVMLLKERQMQALRAEFSPARNTIASRHTLRRWLIL